MLNTKQKEISIALEDISHDNTSTHNESSIFVNMNTEDGFEQIDLKIEKDEIFNNDIQFGNLITNKTPRKIGNLYAFFYNRQNEPLIVIGPHWPFFVCLSTTITFVTIIFFYSLWDYLNSGLKLMGMFFYITQLVSYSFTFLKNPGLPRKKRQAMPKKIADGFKFCDQCHILLNQNDNSSHCDDCNVCILGN
jgi:hypothetical protein